MARIYVGTYAKYNSGSIKGAWVDLGTISDIDTFWEECAELHSDEEEPEYMFQDWEDIPSDLIGESYLSPEVFAWLDLDDDERELLAAYLDAIGGDLDDVHGALDRAREAFAGTARDGAEFAEQLAEDIGAIPRDLPGWIVVDWDATWNQGLRYDYSEAEVGGTTYFFRNM